MKEKYGICNIEQVSRRFYYVGLGMGLVGMICVLVIYAMHIPIAQKLPACVFYSQTGFYCPGCGGTRAVHALLHGEFLKSLYYHPFVIYMAVYYVLFELSHTLHLITRGKIKALNFCPAYFYVGAALVVIQCLIKNYLKFYYGFIL